MDILNLEVNFFAFMLSGLLAFLLGLIWYHPKVMGKQWADANGIDIEKMKLKPFPFIASFFLWILSACFYSFLASFLQIHMAEDPQLAAAGYFALSCMLWVAFAMPPALMGALYTGGSFDGTAIDASYHLGGYYVFAAVHIAYLYM
ncbi:MAG: DUF1761 domain-containing protein [Pseudomonadota bacterium]